MQDTTGLVLVRLTDGNIGNHGVVGPVTKTDYGYRRHGDQFYVAWSDVDAFVRAKQAEKVETAPKEIGDTKPAKHVEEEVTVGIQAGTHTASLRPRNDSLLDINGINAEKLDLLHANNHDLLGYLAAADAEDLAEELHTTVAVATRIINEAGRRTAQ